MTGISLNLDPSKVLMNLMVESEELTQNRIKKKTTEIDQLHAVLNSAISLTSIFSEKPNVSKIDFSNNKEVRDQLNQLFSYNPEWISEFHKNKSNENKFSKSELEKIENSFKEIGQLQQFLMGSPQLDEFELENIRNSLKEKLDGIDPNVYRFDTAQFSKIKYMLIYIEKSTSTKLSQTVSESHQSTEELTLLLKTCNETERRRDQFMKHILSK
ncbi:MAG: hypothetical protein ACRDDW_07380 [Candidatus Rhabdochlamydia sp.]